MTEAERIAELEEVLQGFADAADRAEAMLAKHDLGEIVVFLFALRKAREVLRKPWR